MNGYDPSSTIPIMSGGTGNPFETKLGGGKAGVQIPNIQYQTAKPNTQQQQPVPMPTIGGAAAAGTQNLTNSLQQAFQMYQQRFGQSGNGMGIGGSNLPMNSNAGGVWAGNPTQAQVGPPTPSADVTAQAATNPGVATTSPAIDQANAANTSLPGGSGGAGAAGAAGMGIASALGSVSKAFGQESQTDAKLAANPPKPTVTGQPFANFAFSPMFGGGDLV